MPSYLARYPKENTRKNVKVIALCAHKVLISLKSENNRTRPIATKLTISLAQV